MAISFTCDGCGAAVENPEKVGTVIQREYCASCTPKAEAFVAAEEALRKITQEAFAADRAALISSYDGFKLPDVP